MVAEVLSGKPLLLGASTAKQLVKILQVTGGVPSDDDLEAMGVPVERAHATFAALPSSILPQRLGRLLPRVPTEGLDLVSRLLHLRPASRASIEEVIAHPYLAPFLQDDRDGRTQYVNASLNPAARFAPPIGDARQLAPSEYRAFLGAAANGLAEQLCEEPSVDTINDGLDGCPQLPSEADMGC